MENISKLHFCQWVNFYENDTYEKKLCSLRLAMDLLQQTFLLWMVQSVKKASCLFFQSYDSWWIVVADAADQRLII